MTIRLSHGFQRTDAWGMLLYGALRGVEIAPLVFALLLMSPLVVLGLGRACARVS